MDSSHLVRDARRRHGVSQRSLARRCRTSQTYISRVERGEVSPSVDTLDGLLRAMGERLELGAAKVSLGNLPTKHLRSDFERLTPEERIVQAAELSYALTSLASAGKRA